MNHQEAVNKIKKSKKYKNISEEVISKKVKEYSDKHKLQIFSELDLKEIKSQLHRLHGSFRTETNKLSKHIQNKDYSEALKTNRSTLERLKDYEEIYNQIFNITGKPEIILDLGCGINPISIPFMKINHQKLIYYAYDINEAEIRSLNEFFKLEKIKGEAKVLDLTNIENIKSLPHSDGCFMFKLVDILESKGHKYSEEVIQVLIHKSKHIVVSFATSTIGGKPMKFADRGWIERMLERINLKFEKFIITNEIFYVISKK